MSKANNNNNTRRHHQHRSVVFTVKFEHTSHLFLVFLLLTLHRYMFAGKLGKKFIIKTFEDEIWGFLVNL